MLLFQAFSKFAAAMLFVQAWGELNVAGGHAVMHGNTLRTQFAEDSHVPCLFCLLAHLSVVQKSSLLLLGVV